MRIALDLHGTYDICPEMFENRLLSLPGLEFFLLTGMSSVEVSGWRIGSRPEFQVLSITDYCRRHNLPMDERVNPKTGHKGLYFSGSEHVWWAMKSIICMDNGIRLLIDNCTQYKRFFGMGHPTDFFLFSADRSFPAQFERLSTKLATIGYKMPVER